MVIPVKVLVANRGEIAVRIIRACRELDFLTVAVYSNSDRHAPHVRFADEAVGLGANAPAETYLRIDKLIDAACQCRADAVHPGYGFLAENADFAQACQDAGLLWVGPDAKVIALMGGKTAARQAAKEAGVPVVPGTESPLRDDLTDDEIIEIAAEIGYPLFVKAVAGGGGKGMRLVGTEATLLSAVQAARSEAGSAFGDPSVYLERSVSPARHIEVQVLGDEHGRIVPFVERECSIQRRHQKVIEESPSIAISSRTRLALTSAAAALAKGVGYTNAGTVEFLLDRKEQFYFLEMNTRLQVEHPVTEMVTGIDLVQWQLRIARGDRLTIDANQVLEPNGHAIECRVYAEDPDAGFLPSPGLIRYLRRPAGPGIRDDSGVEEGFEIPVFYDSMISKLVAWGESRSVSVSRLNRALSEYEVGGVKTTLPFFRWLLQRPEFTSGNFDTGFLDGILADSERTTFSSAPEDLDDVVRLATAIRAYLRSGSGRSDAADVSGWRRVARMEAVQK